jgi:hypothetical protein
MAMTPSWLYYLCGALMLVVAAYCLLSLFVEVAAHRPSGWDIDLAHTFMGVSMAGQAVARWAFGPTIMWEIVFATLLVWFVVRALRSLQRYGPHLPHFVVHAAMSLAMLLMYRFPVLASGGTLTGSMAPLTRASRLDPALASVLALTFLSSAIFTLASSNKGRSHHGTHVAPFVVSAAGGPGTLAGNADRGFVPGGGVQGLVGAPWLEDASHVVLCVLMAFLLIVMI